MATPGTILTAAVLALALTASAFPQASSKPSADPQEAVRQTLLSSTRGFSTNDFPAVEAAWSHREEVTVFESGHANYGWADYRDHHLKPEMAEMKNVRYELSDVKVRMAGTTAWSTFKYTIAADLPGRHVDGSGLGTAILEKQENAWKIVHWHTSSPRKPAPAAVKTP